MIKIKTDWSDYLHQLREREIALAFDGVQKKQFAKGLELGCGDGYQSHKLANFCKELVSTDFSEEILPKNQHPGVEYKACDAENILDVFKPASFDFVYSSNLMEHLPNPDKALKGCFDVLKPGGVAIHIIPNSTWKAISIGLFYPERLAILLEKGTDINVWKKRLEKKVRADFCDSSGRKSQHVPSYERVRTTNNHKFDHKPSKFKAVNFMRMTPHGSYHSNFEELWKYRTQRWEALIKEAGFTIERKTNGPLYSGYGFGVDRLRKAGEMAGLASEHVYVCRKP